MELTNIEKIIDTYLDEISIPYKYKPGYDYLKQITCTNKLNSFDGFLNSDIYEVYKGILFLNLENTYSIDEVCNMVDVYRPLLEDQGISFIDLLYNLCASINYKQFFDQSIEYLNETNPFKIKMLDSKYRNLEDSIITSLGYIKQEYPELVPDLVKCIDVIRNCPESMDIFSYIKDILEIKRRLENIDSALSVIKSFVPIKKKNNKIISTFKTSELEDYQFLMDELKMILEFVRSEEKKAKDAEKKKKSEYYSLKNSLNMLKTAVKREEITNPREIVKGVVNEDIKYNILLFIHDYNDEYYKKLDKTFRDLSTNSSLNYSKLLTDYGISIGGVDVPKIMRNSLEEVEKMIISLRKYNLSNVMIVYILSVCSFLKFTNIMSYLSKHFISIEYLKTNLDLFRMDNTDFNLYEDNINVLISNDLNPQIFLNSCYIFFDNSGNFKKNIELLKEYNLLKYIKTTNNFDFLLSDELASKIDMLIEFGYINFLKENIGLLNYNSYMRLCILKEMGMVIDSLEELIHVLDSSEKFIISDKEICNYMDGFVDYKNNDNNNNIFDEINLEEYRDSCRSYSIGGVIVSSNRVQRNIKSGLMGLDAICNGMYNTSDDYESICSTLSEATK